MSGRMNNYLLTYEVYGIRFNVYVVARNWIAAKSLAPKHAKNVNAVWMP